MNKKIVSTFFLMVVGLTFFSPATTPRAEAFFPVIDVKALAGALLNATAQVLAQKTIDSIVKSTINWANSGFQGNPAYVTDPKSYFGQITSGAIGSVIANDSNFGFVCSPFQASIKASLVKQYFPEPSNQGQCTLEQIGVNVDNFYKNFQSGGWNGWFQLTQGGSSPYESYFAIKSDIDNKLANELSIAQQQYQVNSGFLSYKECQVKNPDIPKEAISQFKSGKLSQAAMESTFGEFDLSQPAGACLEYGPVTTPGSVIKSQLDQVLPSGINKLITAQTLNQLASAFAAGLLQKYVFNSSKGGGLFTNKSSAGSGGTGTTGGGNPTGGVGVGQTGSQICDATNSAVQNFDSYLSFLNSNSYDSNSSSSWTNQIVVAKSYLDNFVTSAEGLSIPGFAQPLSALNAFSAQLESIFENIVQNPTYLETTNSSCAGNNFCSQLQLTSNTVNTLDYLKQFQSVASNNCTSPNLSALGSIPAPTISTTTAVPVVNPIPTTPTNTTPFSP